MMALLIGVALEAGAQVLSIDVALVALEAGVLAMSIGMVLEAGALAMLIDMASEAGVQALSTVALSIEIALEAGPVILIVEVNEGFSKVIEMAYFAASPFISTSSSVLLIVERKTKD